MEDGILLVGRIAPMLRGYYSPYPCVSPQATKSAAQPQLSEHECVWT